MNALQELLSRSALGKQILAQAEADPDAERRKLAAQIQTIESEAASAMPKLTAAFDRAAAEYEVRKSAERAALEAYRASDYAMRLMAFSSSSDAERLRLRLADLADPQIGVLIGELWEAIDKSRRVSLPVDMRLAHQAAMKTAIGELDALKVDVTADVPTRLRDIRGRFGL